MNLNVEASNNSNRDNLYWGGGLNWAFNYVLEHDEYDSLLFLNVDLTLNGNDFVKKLKSKCLITIL